MKTVLLFEAIRGWRKKDPTALEFGSGKYGQIETKKQDVAFFIRRQGDIAEKILTFEVKESQADQAFPIMDFNDDDIFQAKDQKGSGEINHIETDGIVSATKLKKDKVEVELQKGKVDSFDVLTSIEAALFKRPVPFVATVPSYVSKEAILNILSRTLWVKNVLVFQFVAIAVDKIVRYDG